MKENVHSAKRAHLRIRVGNQKMLNLGSLNMMRGGHVPRMPATGVVIYSGPCRAGWAAPLSMGLWGLSRGRHAFQKQLREDKVRAQKPCLPVRRQYHKGQVSQN